MKVITITTATIVFFVTTNMSLHACPTAWGLHQHTCSQETIQTETNDCDQTCCINQTNQDDEDNEDD